MSRDEALIFLEENGVLVGDKGNAGLQRASGNGQRAPGSSSHVVCAGTGGLARSQRPSPAGGCAECEMVMAAVFPAPTAYGTGGEMQLQVDGKGTHPTLPAGRWAEPRLRGSAASGARRSPLRLRSTALRQRA